mgnify:CR=1 FL=1
MENLRLNNKIVVILKLLLYCVDVLTWEARYDTVNKRCVYAASLFEPRFKLSTEIPKVNILIYCLFKLMSVEENELAKVISEFLRALPGAERRIFIRRLQA